MPSKMDAKRLRYNSLRQYLPAGTTFQQFLEMSDVEVDKYRKIKDEVNRRKQEAVEKNDSLGQLVKSTDEMFEIHRLNNAYVGADTTFNGSWSDEAILANPEEYLTLIDRQSMGNAVASVKEFARVRKLLSEHGIEMPKKEEKPASSMSEKKKVDELQKKAELEAMLTPEQRLAKRKEEIMRSRRNEL